jgi:hypothetical protein
MTTTATLDGTLGVKLPVRDLATRRTWYEQVFDLRRSDEPGHGRAVTGSRP